MPPDNPYAAPQVVEYKAPRTDCPTAAIDSQDPSFLNSCAIVNRAFRYYWWSWILFPSPLIVCLLGHISDPHSFIILFWGSVGLPQILAFIGHIFFLQVSINPRTRDLIKIAITSQLASWISQGITFYLIIEYLDQYLFEEMWQNPDPAERWAALKMELSMLCSLAFVTVSQVSTLMHWRRWGRYFSLPIVGMLTQIACWSALLPSIGWLLIIVVDHTTTVPEHSQQLVLAFCLMLIIAALVLLYVCVVGALNALLTILRQILLNNGLHEIQTSSDK